MYLTSLIIYPFFFIFYIFFYFISLSFLFFPFLLLFGCFDKMTPSVADDFITYSQFAVDPCETIQIKRYKSSKTGITAVHANIEGPLVSGFLTIATKAFNNDGCPHTLEHLIFLGSEKYPYKGTLDSLAPRAYAPGTNAWTDIDHTCYTMTTAGSDGFLQLLPVYVDHILFPTLTDEGFHTEVHHIDQNGEDAGVVYCEMQARENTMTDRMQRRLQQLVYPQESGYQYEAGGLIENLRTLEIESIRQYHRQFYRPDNLLIVVTGKIDQVDFLSTLEQIDKSILERQHACIHKNNLTFKKTWIPAPYIPDLEHNHVETIYFPGEEHEKMGEITVTWLGPKWNEFLGIQAIQMLNSYLSDTPIAPLKKVFVEKDDPYCTELDFRLQERSRVAITATFQNVPLDKADDVVSVLFSTLRSILDRQEIDMKRMAALIRKEKLKILDEYETRATYMIALPAITASLYGNFGSNDFINALQQAKYLDTLANFTKDDWLHLLRQIYIDTTHTALIGKPSLKMAERLAEEEKLRIDAQRACLGEEGLKMLAAQLAHANRINEAQIPSRIMEGFPIPSVSSISSIEVVTATNPYHRPLDVLETTDNLVQMHINSDGHMRDIPYFIQYDHTLTAFVTISVYMNTSTMPSHLRPYGRIYMDTIFASPMIISQTECISHDDVIQKLERDIVSYDASLGYQASFREYIVVTIKVEAKRYKKGIHWLKHLMWDIQFTPNRLVVAINKTLKDIPQAKRSGKLVSDWTMRAIHTDITKSTEASCSYLYQDTFLPRVLEKLRKDPYQVIQDMNEFRSILCQGENLRVHVTGNILNLKRPKSVFKSWKRYQNKVMKIPSVVRSRDAFGPYGKQPGHCASIIVLPSTESSFSIHSTKGLSDFDSSDIPPLLVLMEMLHAMEGVYTRLVRGLGLAYKCWLSNLTEAGLITLCVYRSSNILCAFEHIKNATHQLATGELQFDTYALEGSKSSVIFDLAACESTRQVAAAQSFINKVLRQSKRQKLDFLKAVQNVTMQDVRNMLLKYILPIFDPHVSNHVLVCSSTKSQEMAHSFLLMGYPAQILKLEDVYARNIFQESPL
ncbi:MAG: Metalloenzyme, LuxS/M16 peptidase-like protein [Benjaminiella poitrasii]|nr:MAG: Metalloenzyme, LuxS/M16 peptidase-like protein [Benjaminiella poitrasii]